MSRSLTSDVHAAATTDASHVQQQPQYAQIEVNTAIAAPMVAAAAGRDAAAAVAATEADFALSPPPTYSLPVDGESYKILHAESDEYPEPTAAQRADPRSKFCDAVIKGHTFANQRREQIQAELRSVVGPGGSFLIDSRVSAHGVTQKMRIQHVLAQVQERHHVGPAWVKEAYKRVRKHKTPAGAGTAGTAVTLARSSSRSSTRSDSSTPTTEDEMRSFASISAINAAAAAAASASLLPLPSLPPLPLPSPSMAASGWTATADGSIKPRIKMSAYNLVKSLGADLSSVDKMRQATAAAANAVEQATSEAIVAMEAWGDAQLALMAATDALPTAAVASSEGSTMATAIIKANHAEKKASAVAKVAALMLAQAKHDQLEIDFSSRPASTAPQTPQSNTPMYSCDSTHSDDGNAGDNGDDQLGLESY